MIKIDITGDQLITRKMNKLKAAVKDPEIVSQAGSVILARIRERYRAETDPSGKKWKKSKAAIREARATLYKTGTLFHSIQLARINKNTVAIGTNVPYGRKHQYGEDGLPVRKFLGISKEDTTVVQQLIIKILNERTR